MRFRRLKGQPGHRSVRVIAALFGALVLMAIVSAGVVIWWNGRLWDEQLRLNREQGFATTAEEVAALYPPIPEERNGAPLFKAAADAQVPYIESLMDRLPIVGNVVLENNRAPYDEDRIVAMRDFLEQNAEALRLLHEGAGFPDAWYDFDLTEEGAGGLADMLPLFAKFRMLARCSAMAIALASHDGDGPRVVESARDTFAMARSLEPMPATMAQLTRRAYPATLFPEIERAMALGALKDDDLAALDTELARLADFTSMREAVKAGAYGWTTGANPSAHARYIGGEVFRRLSTSLSLPKPVGDVVAALGGRIFESLNMGRGLGAVTIAEQRAWVETFDGIPIDASAEVERAFEATPWLTLLRSLDPLGMSWLDPGAIAQPDVYVAVMRARLKVERYRLRHGDWPETLGDLVPEFAEAVPTDPFDGTPLRYRREGDGFRLYSLGRDRLDQNGEGRGGNGDIGMNVLDDDAEGGAHADVE